MDAKTDNAISDSDAFAASWDEPQKSALSQAELDKLTDDLIEALKTVYDPEIPVDIYELGLIYKVDVSDDRDVLVEMTLTAPGCGMGPVIAEDAREKIAQLPQVESAKVHIVWDPVWSPQMISPEGRKTLGLE